MGFVSALGSAVPAQERAGRVSGARTLKELPRWPLASLASAAVAFPAGLDARGLPVGLELIGRPQADEALVAMMGAFETARGFLPRPKRTPGRAELAALDIPRMNELHLQLGCRAFGSRRGKDIGALAPARFRALTEETVKSVLAGR